MSEAPMSGAVAGEEAHGGASRPLVEVRALAKHFSAREGLFGAARVVRAVDGVSFSIGAGETLGLIGESGCGKSTLGRLILRLLEPTSGRVILAGEDITELGFNALRPLRRRMQIVFQDPSSSLDPMMTVRRIVGEGPTALGLASHSKQADDIAAESLAKVGLGPEYLGRRPRELSGGQRQRVAIARALAVRPDFIVCDEPTSALDVSVQAQVLNLLAGLQDDLGVSYLLISHDLRVIAYMSHTIAVMYCGRVVEMGPAREVAEGRLHPYTRALLGAAPGSRERRLLPGEPPGLGAPPSGCAFYGRCPRGEEGKCNVETPALESRVPGGDHKVACFHPEVE